MRSLAVTWLTFAFSLAYDLVPIAPFARIKTSLAVLAVPVEGLVGLLYWSLTVLDPSLLNPATEPGKEPFRIPLALDVSLHGLPAVSSLRSGCRFQSFPDSPVRTRSTSGSTFSPSPRGSRAAPALTSS